MPEPTVSILIPSYNAAKYIGEAIQSALDQTYSKVEVVVVDDGSSDASVSVIKSFGGKIRFEAASHLGGCRARNRALELSTGEFIQFLDADDVMLPTKVETLLPYLHEDKADIVWGQANVFETGKPLRPQQRKTSDPAGDDPTGRDPLIYFLRNIPQTGDPLHRRSLLTKVGGFRPDLPKAQEYDLHLRLGALSPRLLKIPAVLLGIRLHDGPKISSTKTPPGYMLELLMRNARELETSGLLNTPERRDAFADVIAAHSIYTYRAGRPDLARPGFELARTLSPSAAYPERKFVKAIAALVGPMGAEYVLMTARKLRGARAPSAR